jgi:hypothetical protein
MPGFEAFIEAEKRVVRKTEEQGCFFHDLKNGVLNWGSMRVRERVEIKRNDRNPVRKLL